MQFELSRDEAVALCAACEDQSPLMDIVQKRTNGMNVSRAKAIFANLIAKLSDAIEADGKAEQAKVKADLEAKKNEKA